MSNTISPGAIDAYTQTMNDLNSGASGEQIEADAYQFLIASNGGRDPNTENTASAMEDIGNFAYKASFDPLHAKDELEGAMAVDSGHVIREIAKNGPQPQ